MFVLEMGINYVGSSKIRMSVLSLMKKLFFQEGKFSSKDGWMGRGAYIKPGNCDCQELVELREGHSIEYM